MFAELLVTKKKLQWQENTFEKRYWDIWDICKEQNQTEFMQADPRPIYKSQRSVYAYCDFQKQLETFSKSALKRLSVG